MSYPTTLLITAFMTAISITSFAAKITVHHHANTNRYGVYDNHGNALNNPKKKSKQLDNVINMKGIAQAKSASLEGDTIVFG